MNARAAKGTKRKSRSGAAGQKARSARLARLDQELGIDADKGIFGTAMDLLFPKPARAKRKR